MHSHTILNSVVKSDTVYFTLRIHFFAIADFCRSFFYGWKSPPISWVLADDCLFFAWQSQLFSSAHFSMRQSTWIWAQRILLQLVVFRFFSLFLFVSPLASSYAARIPAHNDSALFLLLLVQFCTHSNTTCFYSSTTPLTRDTTYQKYFSKMLVRARAYTQHTRLLDTWTSVRSCEHTKQN